MKLISLLSILFVTLTLNVHAGNKGSAANTSVTARDGSCGSGGCNPCPHGQMYATNSTCTNYGTKPGFTVNSLPFSASDGKRCCIQCTNGFQAAHSASQCQATPPTVATYVSGFGCCKGTPIGGGTVTGGSTSSAITACMPPKTYHSGMSLADCNTAGGTYRPLSAGSPTGLCCY